MRRSRPGCVRSAALLTLALFTALAAAPTNTFAEGGSAFNSIWPTRGQITSFFGDVDRFAPRGHSGLDIAAPEGTPVYAAETGEALKASWDQGGYGGLIIIAHASGYETWYAHLESVGIEAGQHVTRGEQIGLMGSTGLSTGSHLHFEVREGGQLRDPLTFLDQAKLQPATP